MTDQNQPDHFDERPDAGAEIPAPGEGGRLRPGFSLPPEAVASFSEAIGRALRPQMSAFDESLRGQIPRVEIEVPVSALPQVNKRLAQIAQTMMPDMTSALARIASELPTLLEFRAQMPVLTGWMPANWGHGRSGRGVAGVAGGGNPAGLGPAGVDRDRRVGRAGLRGASQDPRGRR